MIRALFIAAAISVLACGSSRPRPAVTATAKTFALPFIDDDYPRALAEARKANKPLFVDVWAPWCHTCLSLRSYVLSDPALAPYADRFVWAAIDTEKPGSAPFVAKFPIEAWPTLLVIDPASEKPLLRWLGAATTAELSLLLDDVGSPGAAVGWINGNRAAAEGRTDDAISAYREALAAAPDPARRARIVDALIGQVGKQDRAACVSLARDELPKLPKGTSRANVALAGLDCARSLPEGDAGRAAIVALVEQIAAIVADKSDPLLADDRSALYEVLVEYLKSSGDAERSKETARAWSAFLDEQAAHAKDPAARMVFDSHRMSAYLALGEPARAVAMLEQSEKDAPSDYNPPARLARVYLAMNDLPRASAAIERALAKAYGPRRLRLYSLKADIAHARNDLAAERTALDEAITFGKSLALTPGYAKLLKQLESRRAAL